MLIHQCAELRRELAAGMITNRCQDIASDLRSALAFTCLLLFKDASVGDIAANGGPENRSSTYQSGRSVLCGNEYIFGCG